MSVVAIALALLSRGIREEAGAVEVDVRVQEIRIERVDLFGELLRDLGIAQMLACHGAVLGLCQGAVSLECRWRDGCTRCAASPTMWRPGY